MQLSRSFYFSFSLLALPLAVACGDDGGIGAMTTTTTPVTPPVAPSVTPSTPVTPPVTPSTPVTPPVTPSTPVTPPVTPSTPVTPPVTPPTPVTPPVTPPATPDLWTEVYPIFQAKCESAFCHGSNEFPPNLVGVEATVRPLAEAAKDKIAMRTSMDAASPMPPSTSGLALTEAERTSIQNWALSL